MVHLCCVCGGWISYIGYRFGLQHHNKHTSHRHQTAAMTKTGTPQTGNNLPEAQNNHKGHHDYNLSKAQDTPKGHNGHELPKAQTPAKGHNNTPITTSTMGKTTTAPKANNLRPKTPTKARSTTIIKTPTKNHHKDSHHKTQNSYIHRKTL